MGQGSWPSVIRKVDAIGLLNYEHRDSRMVPGVGNMSGRCPHDERIANEIADDSGRIAKAIN
jgi:hypothetical protein